MVLSVPPEPCEWYECLDREEQSQLRRTYLGRIADLPADEHRARRTEWCEVVRVAKVIGYGEGIPWWVSDGALNEGQTP